MIRLILTALLLTGCASLENHDSYWNQVRQPYLAGPGWAITGEAK